MLTENVPTRTRRATSKPWSTSAVNTHPDKPYGLSLAMRIASSSFLYGISAVTGPKISSRATAMSLLTLVSRVGSTYQPFGRCAGRPPPVATVAPSARPFAM